MVLSTSNNVGVSPGDEGFKFCPFRSTQGYRHNWRAPTDKTQLPAGGPNAANGPSGIVGNVPPIEWGLRFVTQQLQAA